MKNLKFLNKKTFFIIILISLSIAIKFIHYYLFWMPFIYKPISYQNIHIVQLFENSEEISYLPAFGDVCKDWIFERNCIAVSIKGEKITEDQIKKTIDTMKSVCDNLQKIPVSDHLNKSYKGNFLHKIFQCEKQENGFIYAVKIIENNKVKIHKD